MKIETDKIKTSDKKNVAYKPVVLAILDGFGLNPTNEGNAIAGAKMPFYNELLRTRPITSLNASGISVGLPWGENGNSEVGHLNLGSGVILYQSLPRISIAIKNGDFYKNKQLVGACEHARKNKSSLHFMGLVSPGGVHSHLEHLYSLLELARRQEIKKVYIHAITDGRDTPKDSAIKYFKELNGKIKDEGVGKIATVCGRFYIMDRDNHWERVEKAYNAIVNGKGKEAKNAIDAIENSYRNNVFDEQIEPVVLKEKGEPIAQIKENDALIFFNYRADRARQITETFALPTFVKFQRGPKIKNLLFVTMTQYQENLPVRVAFPPQEIKEPLSKILADNGNVQLHAGESEKYAHVTYFFNGGIEKPFPGQKNIVIPSPDVASYDKTPEMSSRELTEKVVQKIYTGKFDFIVINFASPDMVGHTGNFNATVKALEFLDTKLKELVEAAISINGAILITADHGNCEQLIDPGTHEMDKEHSTNPVPFIYINKDNRTTEKSEDALNQILYNPTGVLADVAPTILELMHIPKPQEMNGISLLNSLA